jgi:hypothetical protein
MTDILEIEGESMVPMSDGQADPQEEEKKTNNPNLMLLANLELSQISKISKNSG